MTARSVLVLMVSLGCATASAAEAPSERGPALRFDPFARPALVESARGARPAEQDSWAPTLRATLMAGDRSLANLGGTVLGVGEESHGYRLVEVRPFEAVFERDGATVVLEVERGEDR